MRRYEFIENKPWENPNGKWVNHTDHAAELATLRAENERLRGKLEQVQTVYQVTHCHAIAKEALK